MKRLFRYPLCKSHFHATMAKTKQEDTKMFYDRVKESTDYIRSRVSQKIDVAIILGSGLGKLVDIMENKQVIPYGEIPNFPQSSVAGHAGNLVFGTIGNTSVMALQGRFHYYEGFTMKEVAYFVAQKLATIEDVISTATHFVLRKYKDKGVIYGVVDVDERGNCGR